MLVPIGFVSDHVEVLYDIDIVFRDYGMKKGSFRFPLRVVERQSDLYSGVLPRLCPIALARLRPWGIPVSYSHSIRRSRFWAEAFRALPPRTRWPRRGRPALPSMSSLLKGALGWAASSRRNTLRDSSSREDPTVSSPKSPKLRTVPGTRPGRFPDRLQGPERKLISCMAASFFPCRKASCCWSPRELWPFVNSPLLPLGSKIQIDRGVVF